MFIEAAPSTGPRSMPGLARNAMIAGSVILLHVVALWALQSGLLRRAVEIFVPVQILSEIVEQPRPVVPPPPPLPPPPMVTKQVAVKTKMSTPPPPPQPQAVLNPDPAPNAPAGVTTAPVQLSPIVAPAAIAETPAAPTARPAPPKIELPSSDAEYLQNPKSAYPPISRRLGEQGTVLIQVLIGIDGNAQRAEIRKSSGFIRLDQAALSTVLTWRYVPGKRAGVPEAMWFTVPITFALE